MPDFVVPFTFRELATIQLCLRAVRRRSTAIVAGDHTISGDEIDTLYTRLATLIGGYHEIRE